MSRIEKLLELMQTSAEDSFLQHALALEYIKAGDDEKARALFEAILEREPGYVGSYYHLGKLLERMGEPAAAAEVYRKGMVTAKSVPDQHSYNELQGALEEIEDE